MYKSQRVFFIYKNTCVFMLILGLDRLDIEMVMEYPAG